MARLPYPPRPFQEAAVDLVAAAAKEGGHLVLEAPTGTGKTVLLLAGALEAGRRILYTTRTNSQQEQAVRELVAIGRHRGQPVPAVALQGRHRLCLKLEDQDDPDIRSSTPEELGHYCRHAKRRADEDPNDPKACAYWRRLGALDDAQLAELTGPDPLTAEAFKQRGRAHGVCSYEASKRLLSAARVVIAPYVFAFDPGLRRRLFEWWGADPADVVLLIDEAHNLPDYVRQLQSPRLGAETLRRALTESESLHHPVVARDVTSRALLDALLETLHASVEEYAGDEDGLLPPFEVEGELLDRFRMTTRGLRGAADTLILLGEIIKDRQRRAGKVPRSRLAHAGAFLAAWMDAGETSHVKLVVRQPRLGLEAYCVDASSGAAILDGFHATVHASGTLDPLVEYRDSLGLGESTRLERFPSPFPPDRLRVAVASDLTTKYERLREDPGLVDRLQAAVARFVAVSRVSAAVFFPSHQLLDEFSEVGVFAQAKLAVLRERRDLPQETLMHMVHRHRAQEGGSLLTGVLGGRLSEGLDFPGRQLEALLVVGTPFPKPTARQRALFRFHESHHGRGWDYAVKAPAQRRLRQALGRLIRHDDDRGFAAILDARARPLLEAAGVEVRFVPVAQLLDDYAAWQSHPPAYDTVK